MTERYAELGGRPDYEGSRRRRPRVIVRAYVDTGALDIACPACHAPIAEYCTNSAGEIRHIPCIRRVVPPAVETHSVTTELE
jgi:hypothetical protein